LIAVRIEIQVFYRHQLVPWVTRGRGWKFSARREKGDKFLRTFGSPEKDVFDPVDKRPAYLIPFDSQCEEPSARAPVRVVYQDILDVAKIARDSGHKAIVQTMLPCGKD